MKFCYLIGTFKFKYLIDALFNVGSTNVKFKKFAVF